MRKRLSVIFLINLIFSFVMLTGCNKDYLQYKSEKGYDAYISDSKAGYDYMTYYNCDEAMLTSESAREYYINNKRCCGDYIITNYEDAVCINRYMGDKNKDVIEIPEMLDGKPVIKIGGYLKEENVKNDDADVLGAFAGCKNFTLKIPSTVKYIGFEIFRFYSGIVSVEEQYYTTLVDDIQVDENNPYYSSSDGVLYSKDKKILLYNSHFEWINADISEYVVPEFVETFAPSNGVANTPFALVIGKNVKKIDTFIDMGEDGCEPNPDILPDVAVKGYKSTAAEEWAKEWYANFIEIKD